MFETSFRLNRAKFSRVGARTALIKSIDLDLRRSLDLTGPLLLGGVPNLPEDFPVRNRDFVGCMRNLRIDSRAIDMDSYIANNGTAAGDEAQKSDTRNQNCPHCQQWKSAFYKKVLIVDTSCSGIQG